MTVTSVNSLWLIYRVVDLLVDLLVYLLILVFAEGGGYKCFLLCKMNIIYIFIWWEIVDLFLSFLLASC